MISFENYTIRALEQEDLVKFFDLVERNRSRLEDFFAGTVSKTQNIESTKIFLAESQHKKAQKTYFSYVIVDNSTDDFIAFFDLKNIDWSISKTELGFYTDKDYAGKGITTKALNLFLGHCFKQYDFKKIFLRTHKSNKAAQALALRCGFKLEGKIRNDYKTTSGQLVDLMYYGLIP